VAERIGNGLQNRSDVGSNPTLDSMYVIYQALSMGEIPSLQFDKRAFKWAVERQYVKCECCGQYLPGAFLTPTKTTTKWKKATGRTTLCMEEVRKSELRSYLTKLARRLPKKYGNKGTLIVLFQPEDVKDHSRYSLDKSEEWNAGVAYVTDNYAAEVRELYDCPAGAPKRITRMV
jgi:hypothetical protein